MHRFFRTRGVVIYPDDLSLESWPELASRAKLTTIALHHGSSPSKVVQFIRGEAGQAFLERCSELGLQVEYELHAMSELLPRDLFEVNPEMFREDASGSRRKDGNLCVHSSAALHEAALNAARIASELKPTSGRYFLWGDDGAAWCRCAKCRDLTDSDQALLLENHVLGALRAVDAKATLAHLAYANTMAPPKSVRPENGVFLEFAPIHRAYDRAYDEQSGGDSLHSLDENLKVFRKESAQALEYWLDMSRFSGWKRPVPAIPWRRGLFRRDLDAYASRGISNVTSFAAWIDAEYVKNHPDLRFIQEYGDDLARKVAKA